LQDPSGVYADYGPSDNDNSVTDLQDPSGEYADYGPGDNDNNYNEYGEGFYDADGETFLKCLKLTGIVSRDWGGLLMVLLD
jgi:hypothetical protein